MSTRSSIAYVNADGSVDSVYCHFDGYPSGVGACLVIAHNNEADAKRITELGDISVLDRYLEPTSEHTFDNPQKEVTIFYGRDRGEDGVGSHHWECFDDWLEMANDVYDAEYCYWWEDGKWHCIGTWDEEETDLYYLVNKGDGMDIRLQLSNISKEDYTAVIKLLESLDIEYEEIY